MEKFHLPRRSNRETTKYLRIAPSELSRKVDVAKVVSLGMFKVKSKENSQMVV